MPAISKCYSYRLTKNICSGITVLKCGNAVGISHNTVKKYVDGLIEKRLIEAEQTQVTTKYGRRNGNLCYTIRPIEEAVQYHFEQQLQMLSFQQTQERARQKLAEYDRKHGKKAV